MFNLNQSNLRIPSQKFSGKLYHYRGPQSAVSKKEIGV